MKKIIEVKYGSHLYGTASSESDLDIKSVYLPSASDILLQRIKPVISNGSNKEFGKKNNASDIDDESYSISKFLHLIAEGQMLAIEMIFAPEGSYLQAPTRIWYEIQNFGKTLLTKKIEPYYLYCHKQIRKYGVKGSRVGVAKEMLNFFTLPGHSEQKLSDISEMLLEIVVNSESACIKEIDGILFLEICGRKFSFNEKISNVIVALKAFIDKYGQRSFEAENNTNVDWKAVSHAVRVLYEAKELLTYNMITFPRPEAEYLLKIKEGKFIFSTIIEKIESLYEEVKIASHNSKLPDLLDLEKIDNYIKKIYTEIIINEMNE